MKIDEEYVKGVSYYIGDGRMTAPRSLSTANQNPKTIRFFIKWLRKYFKIPLTKIKIKIKVSDPCFNKYHILNEFSKKLYIKKEKIHSISLKHNSKPHHNTIIEVWANDSKSTKEFHGSILEVKKRCLRNKRLALAYIKGIMAAEGSPKYNVRTASRNIHLKMKDKKEIKYIGKLLNDILKVKSNIFKVKNEEGMWLITISNFYEIKKCYEFDFFEIESRKREKLNKIFSSYKREQVKKGDVERFYIEKLKFFNSKLKKRLTAPELANLIKRNRTRTVFVLRSLMAKGVIKGKRKKSTGRPFEFWIDN